jgi:DUF917 family protein
MNHEMQLDEASLLELVYGGAVLGAGGGGSISAGLAAGRAALQAGKPRLLAIADLPDTACLVTLSSVGPVRNTIDEDTLGRGHMRAMELFLRMSNHKVGGFISSEVGALAVTYGWQQSIFTGVPIVDAPCNGRAHPLGLMGSLGLYRFPAHVTTTVGVGGKARSDRSLELALRTNVISAARMIRGAAAIAGITLAVARNPVPASYVRRHAALGGLASARRLGKVLLKNLNKGTAAVLQSITEAAGGAVATEGYVTSAAMAERNGFTAGRIVIDADDGSRVLVPVCNEYMMAIRNGSSVAAFPDLITIFDRQSALPLNSTEVTAGQSVAIVIVPGQNLNLGSTMRDRNLLRPIEDLLKIRFPPREPCRTMVV